jgi:hypothetical protein
MDETQAAGTQATGTQATETHATEKQATAKKSAPSAAPRARLDGGGRVSAFVRRVPGFALLPMLLLAAIALPFRYTTTLAEPDLAAMMSGLVYGSTSGLGLGAGHQYGVQFSFGHYALIYAVAPPATLSDPVSAAQFMNAAGLVFGLIAALLCSLYLSTLFSLRTAVGASVLFLMSPLMLYTALSGHPIVPACACLFAVGCLFAAARRASGYPQLGLYVLAGVVAAMGLSLRAEIALAFPFLCLAFPPGKAVPRERWREFGVRAACLVAAFAVFLALQQPYVEAKGGSAASLADFVLGTLSPGKLPRGLVVLILASGIALAGVATLAAFAFPRAGLERRRVLGLALLLGAPAFAFWVANPQPARHFLLVDLALCLVAAAFLAGRAASNRNLGYAGWLATVVLGNQVLGEALRPLIVSRYEWTYPAVGPRRATQQVPIGVFPLDQRANQRRERALEQEAEALTRRLPDRLLIFADAPHYLVGYALSRDPALRMRVQYVKDVKVEFLERPGRQIALVNKTPAWPRDVIGELLDEPVWRDWPVYVQALTISRYDRTAVPASRLLETGS